MKVVAVLTGDRLAVKKLMEEIDRVADQLAIVVEYHE